MLLRPIYLFLCITLFALTAAAALAGTDVQLLDANGKSLGPSQVDKVNITKTCGGCHEAAKYSSSVHFNRAQKGADAESGSCLNCHLPKKDAFNADGTVKAMTTDVQDDSCLGCHSDLGMKAGHPGPAHEGMNCLNCHKSAGHKDQGAPSCKGCHLGKGSAPKPTHTGLPALHLKRIACEGCHVTSTPDGKAPGYIVKDGKIIPVDNAGTVLHHGVVGPTGCMGKKGCADCHSNKSKFFFGTTTTTDKNGNPVTLVNYKSMRLTHRSIEIGVIRESLIKRYGAWLFLLVLAASIGHYVIFGPHKLKLSPKDPEIQRFTLFERFIHWMAMLCFAFLSVTGILFILHIESPTSALRGLHGEFGVAFVLVLVGLVSTWWRHAVFSPCDREWICKMGGYLWIKDCCPADKFNAGQKAFFWAVAVMGGLVISGTGLGLIFGHGKAPAWVYTLHDLAAIALIAGIIGHIYLGIFANPGTLQSIITGRVKAKWAEHHHSIWARKHKK